MKMTIIKNILTVAFVSLACSCAKWTEPESLPIHTPSLEDQNPELYEAYCRSLRDYRDSKHKVMIAKFDNKPGLPASRAEHIDCLPDSVDYVILYNPDNLSDAILAEMKEVREVKGMKTLYQVDYKVINDGYNQYLKDWEAAHAPAETAEEGVGDVPAAQPQSLAEYTGAQMDYYLSLYSKYGYDGISFIYSGKAVVSMTEAEKNAALEVQNVYFSKIYAWKNANLEAVMFFEGKPQSIMVENMSDILNATECIILPSTDVMSMEGFDSNVFAASVSGVPVDRFVVGVSTTSLTDEKDTMGTFAGTDDQGNAKTAVVGAGEWAALTAGYGVAVEKAQNDYYNSVKVYHTIRGSIAAMNPSPLN